MTAVAALAFGGIITSCSHDEALTGNGAINVIDEYDQAFISRFGQPAADHDWGFGTLGKYHPSAGTRSQSSPSVPNITKPYDEAWVATYNQTAKEPNSTNVYDNYDNTTYGPNWGEGGVNSINWNDPQEVADRQYFFGDDGNTDTQEQRYAWALANHPSWLISTPDETYVRNFKITETWNGDINVVASEGLTDNGEATNSERTVVVTGTWNITADQRVGSKGKIIIANGGTVNVASGKKLNMVNQARLVVLPGGKLTGAGTVEVNNGNATGLENYNGGTIDVAVFNNNFGKFYNYGSFKVTEYQGGAQESNIYNHSLVSIDHTGGSTANARVFNACQFYVKNNARLRNYEGVSGSALIVGGELMFSSSADGTTTPTYVGLAAGALVECGTLYNNGTSWSGPTSGGYAVLSVGSITYLNWEQDHPENGGYFENNIYVHADNWGNIPTGNGMAAGSQATADYKFWNIVANCRGNDGVKKIVKSASGEEIIPTDSGFQLGTSGCTPGYKGTPDEVTTRTPDGDVMIIAEDLTQGEHGDFDFNDVVFEVKWESETSAQITLLAAGGTLPLYIGTEDHEVHKEFGVAVNQMVNTGTDLSISLSPKTFTVTGSFGGDAYNIPVFVKKYGEWIELKAEKGKVPKKIAVETRYKWCDERQDIETKYTAFPRYVEKPDATWY